MEYRYLKNREGINLRYGIIESSPKPKQWIIFVHGRTEWIEKYHYLYADLCRPDVNLIAVDVRGQGKSEGNRAHIDSYDQYADDLQTILDANEGLSAGNSHVVCHSMGSLIALHHGIRHKFQPLTMTLSSPLLMLPNKPIPRTFSHPLASVATQIGLGSYSPGIGNHMGTKFETNQLTGDPDRYAAILKNPYPVPEPTFGWVKATIEAMKVVFHPDNRNHFYFPTLMITGEWESIVATEGFKEFQKLQAGNKHFTWHVYPRAKHEIFSESPEILNDAIKRTRAMHEIYG